MEGTKLPMLPGVRRDRKGRNSISEKYNKGHVLANLNNPSLIPVKTTEKVKTDVHQIPLDPTKRKAWLVSQLEELELQEKEKLPSISNGSNALPPITQSNKSSVAGLNNPPNWLKNDRLVLRYYMFFQESVHESPSEFYRVRRCVLQYYLGDNTFQIIEPKSDNSGVPQGTFLKRCQMKKPDGTLYGPKEFLVQSELTLLSRTFRIVDCDAFTRKYMSETEGIEMPEAEAYPEVHDTGRQTNSASSSSNSDTHRADKLGLFVKYDRKVLRFYGCWKKSATSSDIQSYVIHFFLSDNTVEVREVYSRNCGRDPFPLMLRRDKLPKNDTEFISPYDLKCGGTIDVYGRTIVIYGCDDFTKSFYENELGITQVPTTLSFEEKKRHYSLVIPHHDGIGSEEDSLRNCKALVPKPPLAHFDPDNDDKVMRFDAKFVNPVSQDSERKFVISFNIRDKKLSIYEPIKRNSGILGGKFLENGLHKKLSSGGKPVPLSRSDFYVGATITFCVGPFNSSHQTFELTGCDNATTELIQYSSSTDGNNKPSSSEESPLPSSSIDEASGAALAAKDYVNQVEGTLKPKSERDVLLDLMTRFSALYTPYRRKLNKAFLAYDTNRTGTINKTNFEKCLIHATEDITKSDILMLTKYFYSSNAECNYQNFLDSMFSRRVDEVLALNKY